MEAWNSGLQALPPPWSRQPISALLGCGLAPKCGSRSSQVIVIVHMHTALLDVARRNGLHNTCELLLWSRKVGFYTDVAIDNYRYCSSSRAL